MRYVKWALRNLPPAYASFTIVFALDGNWWWAAWSAAMVMFTFQTMPRRVR